MASMSLGHSGGVGSSRTINRLKRPVNNVDWLGREMLEMRIRTTNWMLMMRKYANIFFKRNIFI